MREIGARLFARATEEKARPIADRRRLEAAAAALRDAEVDDAAALEIVRDPAIAACFQSRPLTSLMSLGPEHELLVERERAGVGAWYEFFPRSEGARRFKDGTVKSGTFRSAMKQLPRVRGMGFDVLYLPPIHPIGRINRKGRNNTLDPQPGDPGSPWAIGAAEGGHDTVHPDLGSLADFRAFVRAAEAEGIEVALDLALQAAPDHPWVTEHPGVVHDPPGRHDRLRREPAEEVPGHLPGQLRQRPRGHPRRGAARGPALDRAGREHLPRRQPAHQAPAVLGVAHRHRDGRASRRGVPRRGLHAPGAAAESGFGGIPAELHLLHVAEHEDRARGLPHRARARDRGLRAPEPLREHPGHPDRVPPVRRSPGLPDPRRHRRDRSADVRRVRRVRALRERRTARVRREHRQREVRVQVPRLGGRRGSRRLAGAFPHTAERDPPRASGPRASCATSASTGATTTRSSST